MLSCFHFPAISHTELINQRQQIHTQFSYSTDTSKDPISADSLVHRLIRQTGLSVRRGNFPLWASLTLSTWCLPMSETSCIPKTITNKHVITRSQVTAKCLKSKILSVPSKPSVCLQVFEFQSETSLTSMVTYGYVVLIHHWEMAN